MRPIVLAATLCSIQACAAANGEPEELGQEAQALYGDLATQDCTLAQREAIVEAHRVGMKVAVMDEFDACVRHGMFENYKPCAAGGGDPFSAEAKHVQYTRARDIMRSSNLADVNAVCEALEVIYIGTDVLDQQLESGFSDIERASAAGTIWHEAMHQQDYDHEACGYPEGEYARGTDSVPYIAGECMTAAGIVGRVMAWSADDRAIELPIGRHRASLGHFAGIGDNTIAKFRLPPATRLTYCSHEGSSGTGAECKTIDNPSIRYGGMHSVTAPQLNAISFAQVEPLVLLFSAENYRGKVQALTLGEHRANGNQLSGVGNDQTRSIYVAPGARVRVCEHEGGIAGSGSGACMFYDRVHPAGVLSGVSYAEVQHVVTAFTSRDLYGARASFGAGRWAGAALSTIGDNKIVSLVVPQGLLARVCSDAGSTNQGAGACQLHTRSTFDLGSGLASAVSFLEVTPPQLDTFVLTVNRAAGSGPGVVSSAPLGLACTGPCAASFQARSEVRLTGVSSTHDVSFTGCQRVVGSSCYVTMMSAKTVTAKFVTKQPPNDPDCYGSCLDACIAGGGLFSQCVPLCQDECN
jgi:hypothetical protein